MKILCLLDSLREDLNVALLVVTHDLAAARLIAEKFLVMYLGRIVEEAPTELLFIRLLHPYPQGLLTAISPPQNLGDWLPRLPVNLPTLWSDMWVVRSRRIVLKHKIVADGKCRSPKLATGMVI